MSRIAKLLDHLPELLRRDAAGEPPLFPPADPLQRPRFYVPDLDARPWHDAAAFPWMTRLAGAYDVIRGELDAFLAQQQVTFRDYVGPILHERADAGEWHVLYLDYRGHRWADNCRMFPRLMELVDQIPRRSGTVFAGSLLNSETLVVLMVVSLAGAAGGNSILTPKVSDEIVAFSLPD